MATTTELLSSAHSVLESHAQLMKSIEMNHSRRRELVSQLPPFVTAGVTLPDLPTRSPSPDLPPGDNTLRNTRGDYLERERERQLQRTDLDKDKMAKVRRYRNYVPEEETIRNDYSQQCVDGGQWPQNWVLGAELEQRFEE
jgi:mRNA (2'-O-methyladenosine-N6-)-methyltransferase